MHKQSLKWEKAKLGDIVSFKTGKLNSNAATPNGTYPFFTCSQETFRTDTYSFDTDCVLLGGNNANGIYPLKYFSGKFDAYQRTYIIRTLDERNLSNRYLFFALRLKLDLLKSISTGAATKFLTLTILKDIDFDLPLLPTQHKIAFILSTYDDLIENNTRRIQILEEMAQALYREWFVEFRFPGHEKVKMVESELGMVPDGWEIRKLGDIAREIRRSVKPDQINPETPYVGLQHIPRKSIALSEWGMASEVKSTKLSFEVGEILFGKIRPYFHKVAVAPIDGVCSTDTIVISPKDAKLFSIVLACVSSEEFVSHATQTSQGTKMPRADWKVLIKYPVAIPPSPLLIRFDEFIKDVLNQIQNMIFRNKNLRSTRDLLLPKFISGEVSVDNFNINMGGIN